MNDYISVMQRNENMCMSYILKAQQERSRNGGVASKAECVYLQEAAKLQAEMAAMSIGAARKQHEDQKRDLDSRIRMLVAELEPERFTPKGNSSSSSSSSSDSGSAGANEQSTGSSSVSDDVVKGWFQEDTSHGFEAVAGMADTVAKLRSCISETKHAGLRSYLKMSNTHGFLLFGPPGCGKTFIATAFAHELLQKDYKYLKLVGADILSKYVGEAENIVKRIFEEAQKNAPCIVFIDEIDSLCKNRSLPSLPEYASSITTAFLNGYNTIVDRTDRNKDKTIIFIAATNYPNLVDDAMVDRMELIRIPLPDEASRADAFRHKLADLIQREDDFTFEDMARMTEKYNRRDIDRLVEGIMNLVLKDLSAYDDDMAVEILKTGEYLLTRDLFCRALETCIPSPKDNILKEQEEWEARLLKARDQD